MKSNPLVKVPLSIENSRASSREGGNIGHDRKECPPKMVQMVLGFCALPCGRHASTTPSPTVQLTNTYICFSRLAISSSSKESYRTFFLRESILQYTAMHQCQSRHLQNIVTFSCISCIRLWLYMFFKLTQLYAESLGGVLDSPLYPSVVCSQTNSITATGTGLSRYLHAVIKSITHEVHFHPNQTHS